MRLPSDAQCRRFLLLVASGACVLALSYLVIFCLIRLLLPFLFAILCATALQPLVLLLRRRFRCSQKVAGIVAFFLFFATVFSLLWLLLLRLFFELREFALSLGDNAEGMVSALLGGLSRLSERLPFLRRFLPTDPQGLLSRLGTLATSALSTLSQGILKMLLSIPDLLFFTVIFFCATFYLCYDFPNLCAKGGGWLPRGVRDGLQRLKEQARTVGAQYLRAYLLLLLFTFALLLLGLSLLRVPYALVLSVLIALLDLLPVIGVGTALIPMAIGFALFGWGWVAIGLIVLYLVITVLRQFAEPRLLSRGSGVHPLLTLLSMYMGYRLFGIGGMLLLPFVCLILFGVFSKKALPSG